MRMMRSRTTLCNQRLQMPSKRVSPKNGPTSWPIYNLQFIEMPDAAPDYSMQSTTPDALRASFTEKLPDIMTHLPNLQFVEMHDPTVRSQGSQDQGQGVMPSLRMAISFLIRLCGGPRSSTALGRNFSME